MAYTKKTLDELNIMDDFLMNALTSIPEIREPFCRTLLSGLLGRKIGQVRVISQRTIPAFSPESRGIRMDVEVEEAIDEADTAAPSMNIYDLEPHTKNDLDLPRHGRFYQAKFDSRSLKHGEKNFSRMPNLYLISILNYDPFGYGYMMYTIHNRCEEVPELDYRDGVRYIYFYTDGNKGGTKEIKTILQYLKQSRREYAVDEVTSALQTFVDQVKHLSEVRDEFMTFGDIIDGERAEEREEVRRQTIIELLEELGPVPDEVKTALAQISDETELKRLLKAAARAGGIEDFTAQINNKTSKGAYI